MRTLGAVLILVLTSAALAGPPGGGGGGGSHGGGGGGGSGGGSHASAGTASHGDATTRGMSAVHAAAAPGSSPRASTPVTRNAATAGKPPSKPGFWRRHFHFHHYAATPAPTYGTVCSEEDRRLGRCPKPALQKR